MEESQISYSLPALHITTFHRLAWKSGSTSRPILQAHLTNDFDDKHTRTHTQLPFLRSRRLLHWTAKPEKRLLRPPKKKFQPNSKDSPRSPLFFAPSFGLALAAGVPIRPHAPTLLGRYRSNLFPLVFFFFLLSYKTGVCFL